MLAVSATLSESTAASARRQCRPNKRTRMPPARLQPEGVPYGPDALPDQIDAPLGQ
jgi:hypothetical protein